MVVIAAAASLNATIVRARFHSSIPASIKYYTLQMVLD